MGTKQRDMDMVTFAGCLATIAHPFVKAALVREVAETGSDAWTEEVRSNLRALLRESNALDSEAKGLAMELQGSLSTQLTPNEREVAQTAERVGKLMAAAWVQFSVLAMRGKSELPLTAALLPQVAAVPQNLWSALRNSLNATVIDRDTAPRIMEVFAKKHVDPDGLLELPSGLRVEVRRGQSPYVLQRL